EGRGERRGWVGEGGAAARRGGGRGRGADRLEPPAGSGAKCPGGRVGTPRRCSRLEGMGGGNSRRRIASLWHIGCSPLLAAARVRIRLLCARGPDVEGTDCPGSCKGGRLRWDERGVGLDQGRGSVT